MVNLEALIYGYNALVSYLSNHTVTCLIPAFFIAGAISAFVKKDTIQKYFGANVKKYISYSIASISGTVLAVCSCTILPLFGGIYKRGSGIGPATTFLYSGPAINILAIIYTANVLGIDLGVARAFAAIIISIIIGYIMSLLFDSENGSKKNDNMKKNSINEEYSEKNQVPTLMLFVLLVSILVIATSGINILIKVFTVSILIVSIILLLRYYFEKSQINDWGYESWDLTKKIFPVLLVGTFIIGMISYFIPPETFRPVFGNNSLTSTFLASITGAILYMPTLLEVPIIGTTFGYTSGMMASGPALSLLLAGPGISLPNMVVINRIMGTKKAAAYITLVVIFSTISGFLYGALVG